eukprot:2488612-Pyramimonas_sp.AAC.1
MLDLFPGFLYFCARPVPGRAQFSAPLLFACGVIRISYVFSTAAGAMGVPVVWLQGGWHIMGVP